MDKDKTIHTIQLFDIHAQEYQDKYMDQDLYLDSLKLFCDLITSSDATVLDVACGPGNISKYVLSQHKGHKIVGIDLSMKMLNLAQINVPEATFKLMDCREVLQLNQKFDAIICGFGMPYLTKEEAIKFIDDCSKLLNSHGVFYFSTMEDDYDKSDYVTSSSGNPDTAMFIHYHESEYLINALKEAHFKIVDINRKLFTYDNGKTNNDLIIISKLK